MHVVARNIIKIELDRRLTHRQQAAVTRIKALVKNPQLTEWQRQHLKALLDLPLN